MKKIRLLFEENQMVWTIQFNCIVQTIWFNELMKIFKKVHKDYGNTGCRVIKQGVQNWKDFA